VGGKGVDARGEKREATLRFKTRPATVQQEKKGYAFPNQERKQNAKDRIEKKNLKRGPQGKERVVRSSMSA